MFKAKHLFQVVLGAVVLCLASIISVRATVIVQAGFSGTNGAGISGAAPDTTNLPGGTWSVDAFNSGGGFGATINTSQGNPAPALFMNCAGNSSGSGAVSIASAGSYVKPATITIQADLNVNGMQTGNSPHGAMLGFYGTLPTAGTDPISGFTGLVLQHDGSLVLVANGATVSTINYTGTFTASNFNTLSYTINTSTGAISNVTLTGSTSTYNFTTTGFTNAATAYAVIGGRNSFGRDQSAYADNFIVSTPNTVSTIIKAGFSGTNGAGIAGTVPDTTNLPGGTWSVDADNNGGGFGATISTAQGSPAPALFLNCAGNSSGSGAISIASAGSYVKPASISIQADLNVAGMQTGNAPHGGMLGFYGTLPSTGADPITGFTGLVLQEDGSLVLVANGTTVSTINYTGAFTAGNFNTLAYTINTTTGAISNVTLTGSTSTYNFSTTSFTNAATTYAVIGGRNSYNRDQSAYADNFIVSSGSGGGGGGGGGGGITATQANAFLSSIGVNIHDDQIGNDSSYTTLFQYSGIRNARGGDGQAAGQVTLHNATKVTGVNPGVMFNILFFGGSSISSDITDAKTVQAAGALLSIEGPNEPNNETFTYGGVLGGGSNTWLPVAQYQRDVYSAVKSDSVLGTSGVNIPVFDLTEGGAETDNVGLQFLTIPSGSGLTMPDGTKYADFANVHNYVAPTANNNTWNGASPNEPGPSDGMSGEYFGTTWNHHYTALPLGSTPIPMVSTEFGGSTSSSDTSSPLTQDQQGKLALNQFLSQFARGFKYSFWYEMRDNEGGNAGFGLFDSSSNPKLAATYIKNLTTILADDATFTPGSVNYTIPSEPTTVHDLLLETSAGVYYLVVWDDKPVGSATDAVTVNLGATYTVNKYDPTVGTTATSLGSVSSVPLSLSDHPLIISLH